MVNALEIDDVSKRYGDVVALDRLSLDLRAGEVFGFVGSNGAGKSTAMRIVLGVLAADSGEVRWRGRPITADDRRRIGYMPEERGLYPRMKVGEQLIYLARLHGLSPSAARAAMTRWVERLGVAERVGDEVQKLSLGNQQRVQLAAALVHDPEVLVLDEPFSGLDPIAVDVMSEVLREACRRGVPCMFSSHQLDLVQRLCDRVAIVQRGALVASGTVAQLRSGGPAQLVVRVAGAPAGWAAGLPGVREVAPSQDEAPGSTVLELADGADDQAVLAAALRVGPVHEFRRREPSLTELYRHVVSEADRRSATSATSAGKAAA